MATIRIPERIRNLNWKKIGTVALYVFLSVTSAGMVFLFLGVLYVGHPTAPDYENPRNALITLGIFLVAGVTIYTFRGGGCRKK